jgi:hypothetical protein
VLPIPIYRRKSQPPTLDFFAKPVGILLHTIAGQSIAAASAPIEFDLLPNVLIKRQQTFVFGLREIHQSRPHGLQMPETSWEFGILGI